MSDFEIEKMIREYYSEITPDDFDTIKNRCMEQKALPKEAKVTSFRPKKRNRGIIRLCLAAMLVLVLGAAALGVRARTIPTDVIQIDVNPSVEIQLNRFGEVVQCRALNNDAEEIVTTMQNKKSSVEEAVKNTVSGLIDRGYINQQDNAMLISVIGSNPNRAEKLEEIAVTTAQNTGKENGVELRIYQQHFQEEEQLKEIAEQYGISEGKAAFVQTVQETISETTDSTDSDELYSMTVKQLDDTLVELSGTPVITAENEDSETKAEESETPTPSSTQSASPTTPVTAPTTPTPTATPTPTPTATAGEEDPIVTPEPTATPTPTATPEPEDPILTPPPAVTDENAS